MSHPNPIDEKRPLFPSKWVIGTAAADLARNDPGVLLPGDPIPDGMRDGVPAHDAGSPSHAEEIAALRAENERLRRKIMGSRQRRDTPQLDDRQGVETAAVPMRAPTADFRQRHRGARRHPARVLSLMVLLLIAVACGWFALQPAQQRAARIQQVRDVAANGYARADGIVQTLGTGLRSLSDRAASLAVGVQTLWSERIDGHRPAPPVTGRDTSNGAAGGRPMSPHADAQGVSFTPSSWWDSQDGRYTIQLARRGSEAELKRVAVRLGGEPFGVLYDADDGESLYSLIYGSFASHAAARAALAGLPSDLQVGGPSIRRIADVRHLIR